MPELPSPGPASAPRAPSTGPEAWPAADPFEDLVAAALEAGAAEREAMLERLQREDPAGARRVRARLAVLGDLGLVLDGVARASDLPERFGSFRRERRVGAGGMGEVWLARDERDGRPAAIKLVRPDHLGFAGARERFRREVAAVTRLDHPGIVRVLEVGEERGVPWIAMEWVGGVSLEEALEHLRGVPPESLTTELFAQAVREASALRPHPEAAIEGAFGRGREPGTLADLAAGLAARVARALAHAHSRGILHRDVKPSNVLVTPAGRVLLADFGLALPRGVDRMTRTGSWLGSLPYAAPEQVDGGARRLDERADVYSLGATLYELCTLRTPFLGGPESTVRRRIATGDLEPPRGLNPALPRALERLRLAALDPDPQRRPATAELLAEELEGVLEGRAVRVRGAPIWLRARRWIRRRPAPALALGAGLVALTGSLALAVRETALAARLTRLGDAELVRALQEEAGGFWPAAPNRLQAMDGWLVRAGEVLARVPEHRRESEALTHRALPYDEADRQRELAGTREELATLALEIDALEDFVVRGERSSARAEGRADEPEAPSRTVLPEGAEARVASLRARTAELRGRMAADPVLWRNDMQQLEDFERCLDAAAARLGERRTFRFAEPLDAWRHGALRRLIEDLERLERLARQVRDQRGTTAELERRFGGGATPAWIRACSEVAASPRYGGLRLAPIFGLEPLGENLVSGLQEFLFLPSGAMPERDPERPGCWRATEESGLVLVLVPGGRFLMGQREGEGPTFPMAHPAREVELSPFLVARTELSVGQAERLGWRPSERPRPADGRLPWVIDWERGHDLLVRHGLELPTEAQWEYAARGDAPLALPLEGRANVLDRSRQAALAGERMASPRFAVDFDDGFPGPAPVGSLLPNEFGLHDTIGNVAEWCLDRFVTRAYSSLWPRPGDGLRATVVPVQLRVERGGSFMEGADVCQPYWRLGDAPGKVPSAIGVRPVRALATP